MILIRRGLGGRSHRLERSGSLSVLTTALTTPLVASTRRKMIDLFGTDWTATVRFAHEVGNEPLRQIDDGASRHLERFINESDFAAHKNTPAPSLARTVEKTARSSAATGSVSRAHFTSILIWQVWPLRCFRGSQPTVRRFRGAKISSPTWLAPTRPISRSTCVNAAGRASVMSTIPSSQTR